MTPLFELDSTIKFGWPTRTMGVRCAWPAAGELLEDLAEICNCSAWCSLLGRDLGGFWCSSWRVCSSSGVPS